MVERDIISLLATALRDKPQTYTLRNITGPELNQSYIPAQLIQAMLGLVSVRGIQLEVPEVISETDILDNGMRVCSMVLVQPPVGKPIMVNCRAQLSNDSSDLGLSVRSIHAEVDVRQRLGVTQKLALKGIDFNQVAAKAVEHFPYCLSLIIDNKLRTLGINTPYMVSGQLGQETLDLTFYQKV